MGRWLISPKVLEPSRRQFSVPDRVADIAVAQVVLDRARVVTLVGKSIAATVPQHVCMHWKRHSRLLARALYQPTKPMRREWRLSLVDEYEPRCGPIAPVESRSVQPAHRLSLWPCAAQAAFIGKRPGGWASRLCLVSQRIKDRKASRIDNYLSAPCFERPASRIPGGFGSPRACATRSALARPTVPVQDTRKHRASGRPPRIPRHP